MCWTQSEVGGLGDAQPRDGGAWRAGGAQAAHLWARAVVRMVTGRGLQALSRCLLGVAIATAMVLAGWAGSASAAPSSGAQASWQAVVKAHVQDVGGHVQAAWGSPVVHTATGDVALLWRCYPGSTGSIQATVYRFTGGAWKVVAQVDPTPLSCADDQPVGTVQETASPPTPERLTGATDFAVLGLAINQPTLSVISDVGGRWHAVPFARPGVPTADRTILPVANDPISQLVVAGRITSATNLCNPCSALDFGDQSTWVYDGAAGMFEPVPSAATTYISLWGSNPDAGVGKPSTLTLGYFNVFAVGSGRIYPSATELTATVNWGDGTSSPAVISDVLGSGRPGQPKGGPGEAEFSVSGSHTFTTPGLTKVTLQVGRLDGPVLGTATASIDVVPADPTARFFQLPGVPTARQVTLYTPASASPGQWPITSRVWTFGDGSEPVVDSTVLDPRYLAILKQMEEDPSKRSLWATGADLGILPTLSQPEDFAQHLSAKMVRSIAKAWLYYFPQHIIPHIYPSEGVYTVSLQITDHAGVTSTYSHSVGVEPHCITSQGPLGLGKAACLALTGAKALTSAPKRHPDYLAYAVTGGFGPGSAGVTITVARDDSVFVAMGSAIGLGSQSVVPSFTISEAAGYVELADLPRSAVSNRAIDRFIDGWTIPATAFFSFGAGLGSSLIFSPSVNQFAQEYLMYAGEGIGVSVGPGCAVDLGKPKDLASLAPTPRHPKRPLQAVHDLLKTQLSRLVGEATALTKQSVVCAEGTLVPSTILFGTGPLPGTTPTPPPPTTTTTLPPMVPSTTTTTTTTVPPTTTTTTVPAAGGGLGPLVGTWAGGNAMFTVDANGAVAYSTPGNTSNGTYGPFSGTVQGNGAGSATGSVTSTSAPAGLPVGTTIQITFDAANDTISVTLGSMPSTEYCGPTTTVASHCQ